MKVLMLMLLVLIILVICLECKKFHFVLIHGAGHGAWCWYKITSRLKQEGHLVDAIDLSSAGINSQDATTVGTLTNYTAPLTLLLQSLPSNEKIVLVGHSLGGVSVTYALENFPGKILAGVYLAALMLPSGPEAFQIYLQIVSNLSSSGIAAFVNGSTAAAYFKLDQVQKYLYNISPIQDVELAKSLLKPSPIFDPTVNFTSSGYGTIARYFIKTLHKDKLFLTTNQENLIQMTPPKKVFSINSDHSPFFSKPDELVYLLLKIAKQN